MDENKVKKYLWFLVEKYGMSYDYQGFKDYRPGGLGFTEIYSFCNESGCFTIMEPQSDDVSYICLDSIDLLKIFILWQTADNKEEREKYEQYFDEKQIHYINIFDVEPEIWKKHRRSGFLKIPFLWGTDKQVLRGLAEVIETQIKKTGQFFGIKVK
ncbi:MAG: hypothetical protein FWD39_04330 [Clostridiales bacterium]|nr:hypothetical protein [Clostridiales bacterium]